MESRDLHLSLNPEQDHPANHSSRADTRSADSGGLPPFELSIPLIIRTVQAELEKSLLRYTSVLPSTLVSMGKLALSGPGKVMSASQDDAAVAAHPPLWPLAVVWSYQAATDSQHRDTWRDAVPAAVAVEIAMAAADLLDEVTDEDPSPVITKHGVGQALNTANLMLVMAQQILLQHALSEAEQAERVLKALFALQEMLVEAAVGQHLDMLYEKMGPKEVSVEMSAEMTEKKAGALIAGACRVGATMSGAPHPVVNLIGRFGREVGAIAQLKNDLQDVIPVPDGHTPNHKTDLRLRKRTLPIVFALHDDSPQVTALQSAFDPDTESGPDFAHEQEMRQVVITAGGVHFTELIIDIHYRNALQALDELEALQPGAQAILSPLLPGVNPSARI